MSVSQRVVHFVVSVVSGIIALAVAYGPSFGGDYVVIGLAAAFALGGMIGAFRGQETI
jgi:hypothetical protein